MTSRTTLTLDEKESIRPDDSASMQAAPEEDGFSASGSMLALSNRDSDTDARAFREQLHEIDQTGMANPVTQGILPPSGILASGSIHAGKLFSAAGLMPNIQLAHTLSSPQQLRAPPNNLIIPPDEKLLEALASPKDRLFVLKIEQDMIDFVKDSK